MEIFFSFLAPVANDTCIHEIMMLNISPPEMSQENSQCNYLRKFCIIKHY